MKRIKKKDTSSINLEITPEIQSLLDKQKELEDKYSKIPKEDRLKSRLMDLGASPDDIEDIRDMFPDLD